MPGLNIDCKGCVLIMIGLVDNELLFNNSMGIFYFYMRRLCGRKQGCEKTADMADGLVSNYETGDARGRCIIQSFDWGKKS